MIDRTELIFIIAEAIKAVLDGEKSVQRAAQEAADEILIDLTDIPETDFSKGIRGKLYRGG